MADQLISTCVHHTLPQSYVRNEAERPRLDEVVPDATIPVVDLSNPDRAAVVAQIGAACRSHGFFQVLNHGLPVELMQAAMAVAHDFFYPKCPSPEMTYGLPAHTDPNALTILLMDDQVAGLQVLKDGKWIAVNPRPNALVINMGDQLQDRHRLDAFVDAHPRVVASFKLSATALCLIICYLARKGEMKLLVEAAKDAAELYSFLAHALILVKQIIFPGSKK